MAIAGGGPAGLAAALEGSRLGLRVLILERDRELGGILNQCIHNGFGLHYFKEELTGPEYAARFIARLDRGPGIIDVSLDTMVLQIIPDPEFVPGLGGEVSTAQARRSFAPMSRLPRHGIRAVSVKGPIDIEAAAIVLAMGCRERTRFSLAIPGTRPAGIFTAGTAQRYVNLEGKMVGRRIVILGSGDIGLIMARRLTLTGAKILACVEILDKPGGLVRNVTQCLDDFGIPLLLSSTITCIHGEKRICGVTIASVDAGRKPVKGTERFLECDTLLLSVGLVPENELSRAAGIVVDPASGGASVDESMRTSVPGIFAAGNVVHVLDLVDKVSEEGEKAACAAAEMIYSITPRPDGGKP
jgi:NADPH-dependent 2,4-dienoyl-CoA reductase/sulfur reductase-like enzyme